MIFRYISGNKLNHAIISGKKIKCRYYIYNNSFDVSSASSDFYD